ncbi:MAG: UvrD-helicase domain-containing protein, partial [Thermodesulfovibrionia bacterium]|nr:UvrD-helicase domain-containing protein [Thermodesulfovibrionia bacterium]
MNKYLDVSKSVVISSPAGSGKTEKLARRYIALLKSGVEAERILAITFTDKAAAEMKQRILKILREEDDILFHKLLQKMPLMRVSTIHSFCGTLIRRFSFEASIDPNYTIEDAIDSRIAWEEILYEILMEAGKEKEGKNLLLQSISERGFRGLENLKATINNLFEKMPFSVEATIPVFSFPARLRSLREELGKWPGASEAIQDYEELFENNTFNRLVSAERHFLTGNKTPRVKVPAQLKDIADYKDWAFNMFLYWKHKNIEEFTRRAERIREIFKKCFLRYSNKKVVNGTLDFSDLEYIAYKLLTENLDWANILFAFDEKTDHILVDEFQDTNSFQWAIIDKLTEEWRSGLGAKREEGIRPTIFLVGDEKQSIYYFRGANVEIFQNAKEKLKGWLGNEFHYEEARENFRSLPAVVDFTNHVFSRIMKTGETAQSWMTRYSQFEACRKDTQGAGKVEIILLEEDEESMAELRKREANLIAKRIQGFVNDFQITDRSASDNSGALSRKRPCKYMDIALLLRKRTHLKIYEEVLRQYGIPFVVVKGVGFYQEPEVAILRSFIYFLSNPKDDYSVYTLLKSPFFSVDEGVIIKAMECEGVGFLSKLKNSGLAVKAVTCLEEWLSQVAYTSVSQLIENALVQTEAWEYFYEAQKRSNVKKFIRIIEDLEAQGKSLFKIRDFLERTHIKPEEPKANVNTEGMDAVRIMTIHAAKGLEFPLVFLPGLDEKFMTKTHENLIYEVDGNLFLKYIPESSIRKQDEDFSQHLKKEEEEQKRLFYVAVTRAEEALVLIGQWSEHNKSFLGFLKEGLGLEKTETGSIISFLINEDIQGLSLLSEKQVDALSRKALKPKTPETPSYPAEVVPIGIREVAQWKAVTEVVNIKRQHGKDWVILGDVIHRLFEGISKKIIPEQDIKERAGKFLVSKGIVGMQKERLLSIIEKDITLLREKRIWHDIILPRENSFSELPFIFETEKTVYTGRIDRVIKENGMYKVYDYKTFPVDKKEIAYLLKGYSFQL